MPKTEDLPIELLLAVMEIEAWFLGEYTHFERVSPNLKLERIRAALQFDPSTDDLEKRKHPTEDLDHIYPWRVEALGPRGLRLL
jgi:hypothetical protein